MEEPPQSERPVISPFRLRACFGVMADSPPVFAASLRRSSAPHSILLNGQPKRAESGHHGAGRFGDRDFWSGDSGFPSGVNPVTFISASFPTPLFPFWRLPDSQLQA